jgi:hypothetical protein
LGRNLSRRSRLRGWLLPPALSRKAYSRKLSGCIPAAGSNSAVGPYEPGLLAKLPSIYMHEYGSDNLVKGGSGIDLVIR